MESETYLSKFLSMQSHPSWGEVFTLFKEEKEKDYNLLIEFLESLEKKREQKVVQGLDKFVGSTGVSKANIFPPTDDYFKAFELCPLDELRVVIIGQDPYHNDGEAMGLCFSVPHGIRIPPSLRNIYKELEQDPKVEFSKPEHGDLTSWASQGVFLLNASLSVFKNEPGVHMKHWRKFTDFVISYISEHTDNTIFMLWGGFAKKKVKLIDAEKHIVLESNHPSPMSANRGGWFGCGHFSTVNEHLDTPIKWQN